MDPGGTSVGAKDGIRGTTGGGDSFEELQRHTPSLLIVCEQLLPPSEVVLQSQHSLPYIDYNKPRINKI